MGVVYQARDPQIDRLVALKVLRQDRISAETLVKRFLKEAKIIGRLSHPNIVTIYDVGEEQGNVYIAMEFLEGMSLSDVLREKRLDAKEVLEFGIQIAATLNYAHQKGVIHRDIKPGNIIVAPDGRIKITDFGIAYIEDSSATLQTQAGVIMGTPAYMSPEQILGQTVDGRSDIFSLGVILYEMITGKRPFGGQGKTMATVFDDIVRITPPEPCISPDLIHRKLSSLIMKALQKEPEKRFQTGRELAEELKVCLCESKPVAVERLPSEKKKQKYGISFAMTILVATLSCGIYYAYHHANKFPPKPSFEQENMLLPKEIASDPTPELKSRPSTDFSETKQGAPAFHNELKSSETLKPERKTITRNEKTSSPSALLEQRPSKLPKEIMAKKESKPTLVPLMLRTSPQGARVYIDKSLKGTTPLTLILSTGKHLVRISRSGYHDVEKMITLEETMEYPLVFQLEAVSESDERDIKPLRDRQKQ